MIANYLGCLRRYILFKGRTSKEQYGDFLYMLLLGGCISLIIWQLSDWGNFSIGNPLNKESWKTYPIVYISLALFVLHLFPLTTASTRRLQDAGYKKRSILLIFIPVLGWLLLMYLLSRKTHAKFLPKSERKPHILHEISHPLATNQQNNPPFVHQKTKGQPSPAIQAIYEHELDALSEQTNYSTKEDNHLSSTLNEYYSSQQRTKLPTALSTNTQPTTPITFTNSITSATAAAPSFLPSEEQPFISILWTDLYITGIEKYGIFSGRAQRKEYWTFILFVCLFWLIPLFLDGLLGWTFPAPPSLDFLTLSLPDFPAEEDLNFTQSILTLYDKKLPLGYLSTLYLILSIIPLLAAQSRRINDTGRKGVFYLFWLLVPLLGISILLLLSLQKSKK